MKPSPEGRKFVVLGDGSAPKTFRVRCECGVEKEVFKVVVYRGSKRIYGCKCVPPTSKSAKSTEWARRHPDRMRNLHLKQRHGISSEIYERMLSEQGGKCAICRCDPNGKNLAVDHCHDSGAIRGLLCRHCNLTLGYARDSIRTLQAAIEYLGAPL